MAENKERGFAAMDEAKPRESAAGKGGKSVSGGREHMAGLGARSGEPSGRPRSTRGEEDKGGEHRKGGK